jgi:hypothetical protein
MTVEAAKLDAKQYTVQYELLRSQVIDTNGNIARGDTAAQPRGIGLALLLSEGMPGWLKTLEEVLRTSFVPRAVTSSDSSQPESLSRCNAAPVWLSTLQRHEVSALLASLVLSTRSFAHSSSKEGYRSWL